VRKQNKAVDRLAQGGDGEMVLERPGNAGAPVSGMRTATEQVELSTGQPQGYLDSSGETRTVSRSAPAASSSLPAPPPPARPRPAAYRSDSDPSRLRSYNPEPEADAPPPIVPAYTGKMAEIQNLLDSGKKEQALAEAVAWQSANPGDVVALVALGQALEALNRQSEAARVYGSIIDLYPGRADLRRYAGCLLERAGASALALDTFEKAAAQRPDHPSSHRMLAYARLRAGDPSGAFAALEQGLARKYPDGRFLECQRILCEDLGLVGAAWLAREPSRKPDVMARLAKCDARLATEPSLRCVLTWETDANDVDFHIHDGKGGHAWYSSKHLPSGGDLYADVTTGYGPECFAITGAPKAYPYKLKAHYFSRGPMGYGMGKLEVVQHDGKGHLNFLQRPFLVMNDQAYVDLGQLDGPLKN
jgi:tetratricopeptide (TPR) repeat protein